jgi:hypothetical protein
MRELEDKTPMNPSAWLDATYNPSGEELRDLCIQGMEILTNNMSWIAQAAEIRRLTPLIRALVPVIVHEPTDEELRAAARLTVSDDCDLVYRASLGEIVPSKKVSRFARHLYTCEDWPSPLPRLMALELGLSTNKRLKHIQAIHLLSRRLGCTIFEFLTKEREEVAAILFPRSPYYGAYGYKTYGVRKLLYR